MPRTTNDYSQSVDFIKAIANIAEPFNSTLLDNYKEYQHDISDYIENDERECFLSILQKSGQDGCSKIYDGIVNYIDDISNIDTSIPSALLSQANSLGYPYKDKSTVNKLAQLTSTNSILQNLVWAFSVSKNNAPIILDRLGLTSTDTELSNALNIDEIYDEISGAMVDELETLFSKKYLYLDYDSEGKKDIEVAESDFSLLNFSWIINSIYDEEIISNGKTLSYFDSIVLDFGKYNRTIYSIICYDYLYDLLFSYSAENLDKSTYTKTSLENIARKSMPFVYDSSLFDPIQAAWSIEYNAAKIEDFDSIYHEQITKFQAYFKKLNHIANDKLINKYNDSKDFKFIPRLNAYSFSYQQLILELFVNVKNLFGIDIKDYIDFDINDIDYWNDLSTMDRFNKGFAYYEFVDRIDFDHYLEKLSNAIFELAKKIKILREDLRIMTLRNSFKGTAALIQFSTIEYLRECIGDIIYQAQSEISDDSKKLTREQIIEIENDISATTQSDVGVDEYWDYTEYFGRVDNNVDNDGVEVDWKLPREGFVSYGTTTEDDIMTFYTDVLHIPKNIYFEYNGNLNDNSSTGYYIDSGEDAKRIKIRQFLATVYNSGVFTKRTDDNYESIYFGNVKETTNESPWINYKNKKYISKEIHPYIWNFTNKIVNRLYKSGAITTAIQDTEYTLVNALIDTNGNILKQFRLSENFIDSSGYITRYEHRDHGTKEVLQSYDGVVYPEFGYKFINQYRNQVTALDPEFYQKWYVDQSNALSEYGQERELNNLSHEHNNIRSYMEDESLSSKALQWYCIDNYETSYAINPINNQFYYKENGYPFMRPLIRFDNGHNLGMMLVDAEDNIITSTTDIYFDFSDGYNLDNDAFPPIRVSQDGTHILIRLNKNLIGSFKTTMHRNHLNEMEKALKVNALISCPDIMFDKDLSNDSLIKSKDDDFYILRQTKGNNYVAQLYYIKKDFKYVKAASQTINGLSGGDLIESGLFLNGGQNAIINTYYVNSNLIVNNSLNYSGALDSSNTEELINGITKYGNIDNQKSSYDVLKQFVQMYSSKLYSGQGTNSDFAINKFELNDKAYPSIDLREVEYANTNVSITNNILAANLRFSTTFPFSRQFNINSDAGFNPIYIGTNGRIILEKRTQQFKYTKTTGGAFELLGPQNDFETDSDPDNPDDSDGDNQDLLRIHELFSEEMPSGSKEEYGKITKISSDTTYSYGYASAVEKAADKDGTYVIDSIVSAAFSIINDDYSAVETENFILKDITTGQNSRIYIFLGVNDKLYSLMPRRKNTELQDINSTSKENTLIYNALRGISSPHTMQFKNTYLIDSLVFSSHKVQLKGKNYDAHEFLNATLWLVNVVSTSATQSPNFMLPTINLINALGGDDTDDIIDAHLRVPHLDTVKSYVEVRAPTGTELNTYELENVTQELSTGSLVFSIIEIDSEKMNHSLPDQVGPYNIKSVTTEAMNDYLKYDSYDGRFDTLSYDFRPFTFHNMNLEREIPAGIEIGYENSSSTSIDDQYIVQPYKDKITINQNSANKYTISFWRSKEEQTPKNQQDTFRVENIVPRDVKTTEITGSKVNPVYGIDKEGLADLINDASFVPQLCVQWKYKDGNSDDPIELKFNNSTAYDSAFINPNSGLEYKSLSQFKDSIVLLPGEQKYIDIVAPNHIRVGMTVFYNIPIIRALVTNISDNKPKFMLTLLNDRADSTVALESNNYALVFTTNSTPQLANNDKTYVQCYVAPIVSANQQNPPSVSNALALSELAFSMDIANILNAIDKELFTANDVNVIAPNDKISETAAPAVSFANGTHQVRIAEPYDSKNMGFSIVDIKLNLIGLSEYTLKNALVSAHGNVIAYDIDGNACPITKIFGTSLDRIGRKNVLGVIDNKNSKPRENVATVTQNSGRKTAIQVNPKLNS